MNKQEVKVALEKYDYELKRELEKYRHELATLKSLKMLINDAFNARIEIVQEKIAECKMFMEKAKKDTDNGNEEKRP
jgi:hypothetical protein